MAMLSMSPTRAMVMTDWNSVPAFSMGNHTSTEGVGRPLGMFPTMGIPWSSRSKMASRTIPKTETVRGPIVLRYQNRGNLFPAFLRPTRTARAAVPMRKVL
jgi:hypothetical protein